MACTIEKTPLQSLTIILLYFHDLSGKAKFSKSEQIRKWPECLLHAYTASNQMAAIALRVRPRVPSHTEKPHCRQGRNGIGTDRNIFIWVFLCGLEKKGAWETKSASLHFTETRNHRARKTVPHRLLTMLTPPVRLLLICLDLLQTDGDMSLGSFVATIKGIPFQFNQRLLQKYSEARH